MSINKFQETFVPGLMLFINDSVLEVLANLGDAIECVILSSSLGVDVEGDVVLIPAYTFEQW
ncbi:hypothetical protein OsccyDRAFT_0646 [Leptolyngbyaceae cyanobacterium JSC-12]|nr:hypothetical protein OsccyDRAFT_0646 [Leptolyngbyaceae cyanobacterium JSC-12]